MFNDFKDSMNTFVANSYNQFIGLYDVFSGKIDSILAELNKQVDTHSYVLQYARNRNKTNEQLNEMLFELMNDPGSIDLLKPFVEKIQRFMETDELIIGKQYLSYDEALYLTTGSYNND